MHATPDRRPRLLPAALCVVAMTVSAGCGGGQDSPEALAENLYAAVADGEFEKACDLILPSIQAKFDQAGRSCQTEIAAQYDAEKRRAVEDVDVDPDKIETNGDTATVPEDAVTFDGKDSTDGSLMLAKQDGKWWFVDGDD